MQQLPSVPGHLDLHKTRGLELQTPRGWEKAHEGFPLALIADGYLWGGDLEKVFVILLAVLEVMQKETGTREDDRDQAVRPSGTLD